MPSKESTNLNVPNDSSLLGHMGVASSCDMSYESTYCIEASGCAVTLPCMVLPVLCHLNVVFHTSCTNCPMERNERSNDIVKRTNAITCTIITQ